MEIKENERLSLLYATFIKSGVSPVKPAIDNSVIERKCGQTLARVRVSRT